MHPAPLLVPLAYLAGALIAGAARLDAQRPANFDDASMPAPPTARSGPTWLIRSPDLRSARVAIAMGVPRDGVVAVHLTEGDVVLDGEFDPGAARAWADSVAALLRETEEREPPAGVARSPAAIGRRGTSLQLEVMGAGARRRFGLVALDSLGVHAVMTELDGGAVRTLVTQLRALGAFASGKRNAETILYALDPPYFEFQVEKPAIAWKGNPPPSYPEDLRAQGVDGEVLLQFVVDTTGRADMRTFKVLRATHPDFIWAVRKVLPRYRFEPAETEGRKVPMYVQMPFKFNIDHGAIPTPRPGTRWP